MSESPYKVRRPVPAPIPDAPGYNLKPDPSTVRSPAELVDALVDLREWADISLREMSRRCDGMPAHSTLSAMEKSRELPKLDMVLVYVDALGLSADRELWRSAWRRLRMRAVA